MTDASDTDRKKADGQAMTDRQADLHAWFLREVLPLEAALTQFLRNNWRNRADVADLLQDVYVRVYQSARKQLPKATRPFLFTTARNLIVDRVRSDKVVPLEVVDDLDALGLAAEAPGPDAQATARDELRRVQAALEQLPPRAREAFVLHHIEGLSQSEIALRMKISDKTVGWHLKEGVETLADLLYGEPPAKRAKP